jgi:parvulin-like peptidyl-prolyl isomerase
MVNFLNIPISNEEIIGFLKERFLLRDICQRIVCLDIAEKTAQRMNLKITQDEIEVEAENFRREKHLEKATDTFKWLTDQLITEEDWERGIQNHILLRRLSEALFQKEVDKYFAEHQLNFEQIVLYQITVPYEALALELFYQIEEEEINFFTAAHFYDIDEVRQRQCGYVGNVYRWNLQPEISAVVFGAEIGKVTDPIPSEDGFTLFLVEKFIQAELTPEHRQTIIDKLLNEWFDRELSHLS